jgi:hypothetical protein
MKKLFILLSFGFLLTCYVDQTYVFARPCNPEIEPCAVVDPPPPLERCIDDTSLGLNMSYNFSEDCTMVTSQVYSRDIFYLNVTSQESITIYGSSDYNLIARLYVYPDYTNPVDEFIVGGDKLPVFSSEGYDIFDETMESGFYFDIEVTSGDILMVKIEDNPDEPGTNYDYNINVTNNCSCVNNMNYYLTDYQTETAVSWFHSVDERANGDFLDYHLTSNAYSLYFDEIEKSIGDFDELGGITFDYYMLFEDLYVDLVIDARYHAEPEYDGIFGWSGYNSDYDKAEIVINTKYSESATYPYSYYRIYSIYAHELAHALGFSMDSDAPKKNHYISTSQTLWELYYGFIGPNYDDLDWDDDIVTLENGNVSRSGSSTYYGLGPCNKKLYKEIWGD